MILQEFRYNLITWKLAEPLYSNSCATISVQNDLAGRSLVGVQVEMDYLQVNSCVNDIVQIL